MLWSAVINAGCVSDCAITGADAGNYTLEATSTTTTASIHPRTVTPMVTVADKRYDGTTAATITSCSVSGVVVGCTGTATFDIGLSQSVFPVRPLAAR